MIAFPPHLTVHDLPHLGVLFKRIRETRGLSQTDVARALGVTSSAISKFESNGRSRRDHIVERYIGALQLPHLNGVQVCAPLDDGEATLLRQISPAAHVVHRHALAIQLSAYDFALIASPHCPPELKLLVQHLRQTRWPAFISDELWFVHAVNGAMLNLFGIAPESPLLRRWESWHMIATKFTEPSPVRAAHISPDNYFPPTIYAFFRATARYLFTPQMRILLRELHHLSEVNGLHFSRWWYSASSFGLHFDLSQSARILRYRGRHLHTSILGLAPQRVSLTAQTDMPYFLGVWQPIGSETQSIFEHMEGAAAPGDVFFAADFDPSHTFHVNCWPELAGEIPLVV